MDKKQLLFRPVSLNNCNKSSSFASVSSVSCHLDKENTANLVLDNMSTQSLDFDASPIVSNLSIMKPTDISMLCENLKGSIDETFLATADSLDTVLTFSTDESANTVSPRRTALRPSISETAYLMKSFSTDEFNQVRNLTNNITAQKKKLSLINPSASKGTPQQQKTFQWVLSSPTDSNQFFSPVKALKRKYKSRSREEISIEQC
jgi:hypothetical protein